VTGPPAAASWSPVDSAVVGGFALAILALGFSARLRETGVLQFLAAGRRLTLPVFVATLVSTWYGGILGVSESVSYFGLGAWVMIGLPFYVFAAIYAVCFAGRVREGAQISIPERLEARFGRSVALAGATLLVLLAIPAAHALMLGVLVRSFTGLDIAAAVILATLAGTVFLYKGGLLADVRVSLLAFVAMYAGFAVMLFSLVQRHPLVETWGSVANRQLLTWDGGQGWPMVLSFFVLGAWTLIDPGFHQRVASAASPEIARRGVLVSAAFWFLFDMLSISTAMYAVALLPASANTGSPLESLSIYPQLAFAELGPGLRALFLCGMLGTIVSAMVGYALISGATIGREIVSRICRVRDESRVVLWTRIGIGLACALAVLVGLSVESVVSLWYTWSGAVVGALLIPVALAYGSERAARCPPGFVLASIVLSSAVAFAWMAHGLKTNNPLLTVELLGAEFSLGTLIPGVAVSAVAIGIGSMLAIIRGKHHGRERSSA